MKITSSNKKLIIGGMCLIGVMITCGWVIGTIAVKDASLILIPLMTGFFSLLKGED